MTSFSMTSLHVDLNEATKCVDIIPFTLLASLSRLSTLVQNTKWRRYLAQLKKIHQPIYESWRHQNLKELTTGGVLQLIRLLTGDGEK